MSEREAEQSTELLACPVALRLKALQKKRARRCLCSHLRAPGIEPLPGTSQSGSPVRGRQRQGDSRPSSPQLLEETGPEQAHEGPRGHTGVRSAEAAWVAASFHRVRFCLLGLFSAARCGVQTDSVTAGRALSVSGTLSPREQSARMSTPVRVFALDSIMEAGMLCQLKPHTSTPCPDTCLGRHVRYGGFVARSRRV